MLKIGNIILRHGLVLAPMAGDTDRAMREICIAHGAEYTVTEMVSAKAVSFEDEKSVKLGKLETNELPGAVQLFGHEPDVMAFAARKMLSSDVKPSAIDINMGCPMKKIVCNGEGSALMKNPALASEIVKAVKSVSDVPVTVKIRTGWDSGSKNAADFACLMQKSGADMIAVHGRTRAEMYSPPVDLETIADVKKAVSVPVIGNGGIYCADDAERMLERTGCDGIMIGRGALGNPWIFDEISCMLDGTEYEKPSFEEIVGTAAEHLRKSAEYKGERIAVLEGRRQTAYYIKDFNGASSFRASLNGCVSLAEIERLLRTLAAV